MLPGCVISTINVWWTLFTYICCWFQNLDHFQKMPWPAYFKWSFSVRNMLTFTNYVDIGLRQLRTNNRSSCTLLVSTIRLSWASVPRFGRLWDSNPWVGFMVVSNQCLKDLPLLLPSQAFNIYIIGLIDSVSGQCDWVWYQIMVLISKASSSHTMPI